MSGPATGRREENVSKVLVRVVTGGAYGSLKRDFATSQIRSQVEIVYAEVDERARATRAAPTDTKEVNSKNLLRPDEPRENANHGVEPLRMADEEPDACASGSNERACLGRRRANRLFDEDVPSGGKRASCEPRVRLDRAGDYYDVSARYGFFVAPEPVDSVGRSRIDAWIVASDDLVAALESAKHPGMHSAHGTQAHQRDLVSSTRSLHASVRPGKMARLGRCLRAQRGQREPEFRSEGSRANSLWRAS
jgi:hypothetical protein